MRIKSWLIALLMAFSFCSYGQIERTAVPIAFGLDEFTYNTYNLPTIPYEDFLAEDLFRDQFKAFPYRYAHTFPVELNHNNPVTPSNPWTWIPLDGGAGVWIISIECPNALSMALTFDKFDLEKGVSMVIYNESLDEVIGQLTYRDNNVHDKIGTIPLTGNRVFVELYIPANKSAEIEIGTVACAYKEPGVYTSTSSCQLDAQCVDDDEMESQLSSVVNILHNDGSEFSTGVLVNSNSSISKPYVITSSKNLNGSPATWSFIFNYQSQSCESTDIDDKFLVSCGAEIVAESEDSDLVLLKLFDSPSVDWETFYNGWNRSTSPPEDFYSIHHAYGGISKLAQSGLDISEAELNGKDVWKVSGWEEGRMDPGCLGAPLFDEEGLITGFFVGGNITCEGENNTHFDYFIPFASCWDDFRSYLDPQNDSPASLSGRDPFVEPSNKFIVDDEIALFPTPAEDFVYIYNENDEAIKWISVYDSQGRFLENIVLSAQEQRVDISHLKRGWYIFEVQLVSHSSSHRVIVK